MQKEGMKSQWSQRTYQVMKDRNFNEVNQIIDVLEDKNEN